MWFAYDSADVVGCAQWLLRREFVALARPSQRNRTPLFSPDGGAVPFAASALGALFRNWVTSAVGADAAMNYSLHSCRAKLASSLQGVLDTPTELIQALCRWRSPESVAQYRRLTAANFASLVRQAMDLDATTQLARPPPVTDDDDAMMERLAADAAASKGQQLRRRGRRNLLCNLRPPPPPPLCSRGQRRAGATARQRGARSISARPMA